MTKNYIFFIVIICLCNSCSIKGSFRGLYSYYQKTKSQKPDLLVKPTQVICEIKNTDIPKVYVINGKELLECLKSYPESIVYIWASRCRSKFCYPLNIIQQKCDKKNIALFIVAEYYDGELMDINYKIKKPIFGIDTEYYNTNLTSSYVSKFIYDLTFIKKTNDSRFLYFVNDTFKKSFDDINEI